MLRQHLREISEVTLVTIVTLRGWRASAFRPNVKLYVVSGVVLAGFHVTENH